MHISIATPLYFHSIIQKKDAIKEFRIIGIWIQHTKYSIIKLCSSSIYDAFAMHKNISHFDKK